MDIENGDCANLAGRNFLNGSPDQALADPFCRRRGVNWNVDDKPPPHDDPLCEVTAMAKNQLPEHDWKAEKKCKDALS